MTDEDRTTPLTVHLEEQEQNSAGENGPKRDGKGKQSALAHWRQKFEADLIEGALEAMKTNVEEELQDLYDERDAFDSDDDENEEKVYDEREAELEDLPEVQAAHLGLAYLIVRAIPVGSGLDALPNCERWLVETAAAELLEHLAMIHSTPASVLAVLASDKFEDIRAGVAKNPSTPTSVLETLAKDEEDWVRRHVAKNTSTPTSVLETLAKQENDWVRRHVAENPSTPTSVLETMAKDVDDWVRRSVAKNPSTPTSVLETMAKDVDGWIRRKVAKNTSTPTSVLETMALDQDYDVWSRVASNPSMPKAVLEILIQDRETLLRGTGTDILRVATTDAIEVALSQSNEDSEIVEAVNSAKDFRGTPGSAKGIH